MPRFDYKVVPAPKKARRVKGVKTTEGRFAHALAQIMNEMGEDGYEYVRTDALPCEERSGWGGRKDITQHMLVFCKVIETGIGADTITSAHLAQAERAPAPVAAVASEPYREPHPEPVYDPEPETQVMPEPVQTFQRLRATEFDPAPEPAPAPPVHRQPEMVERHVANTPRSAFHPAPEPRPETRNEPTVTLPTFRSAKVDTQEPVFSRNLGGPKLGSARYSDDH